MRRRQLPGIRVLGVMTGTSCDGLDAACIELTPEGWSPMWSNEAAYPKALREQVLAFQRPGGNRATLQIWLDLHRKLGEWYGVTLSQMIKRSKDRPDIIANHGQTIAHFPAPKHKGITLQLGDPTRIGYATGLTVVSNFRDGDMAAGGQGAPLVPLFHRLLANGLEGGNEGISIHNIGGISNLTYIGPNGTVLAFDTGPGNIWIDAAAELASAGKLKMDRGGKLAQKGEIDWKGADRVLEHPYFAKAAPKSTGRDDFPFEFLLKKTRTRGAALVATASAVTVESIARAYEKSILDKGLPLRRILLCGGGAKNPALLSGLQQRLPNVEIGTLSDEGIDGQLVEAQAFAFFGFLSLLGQPLGGSWTGATGFAPPGHIIPGRNWAEIQAKLRAFLPRR